MTIPNVSKNVAIIILKSLDHLYYIENISIISDKDYSAWKEAWQEKWPENPYFKEVGANVEALATKGLRVVELPKVMPSLEKKRPNEVVKWITDNPAVRFVQSPKLDGMAVCLEYKRGKLMSAMTRGDGHIGVDITPKIRNVTGVPLTIKDKGHLIVAGELVIHKSTFNKKYHKKNGGKFKGIRNYVGGLLTHVLLSPDVVQGLNDCRVVCFSLIYNDSFLLSKTEEWQTLEKLGFQTVLAPDDFNKKLKIKNEMEVKSKGLVSDHFTRLFDKWLKQIDFAQDGVVVDVDSLADRKAFGDLTAKRPKWAYAVKPDVENQQAFTGVLSHVERNMSRRRLFKPVGILAKPIEFEGADVTRCSFHNEKQVKQWKAGKGSTVTMIRSGDVIPRTLKSEGGVYDPLKKCPYCQSKLKWTDTETDIYCPNEACPGQELACIVHFFRSLKIDFISYGTVELLVKNGFDSVLKIIEAKPKKLKKIEGIGKKKADIIVKGIKARLSSISLADLTFASAIFSNETMGLGVDKLGKCIEPLSNKCVISKDIKKSGMYETLIKVPGIGEKSARLFVDKLPEFRKFFSLIQDHVILAKAPTVKKGKLSGKYFCFTKFRDADLIKKIQDNGGVVENNLKKTTTALFYMEESTKTAKAHEYKIETVQAAKAKDYIDKLL